MSINCTNSIQVEIYGQSLEDLQKSGVVLDEVLKNLGCANIRIIERSVDHQLASTSPSTSRIEVPRFSTPLCSNIGSRSNLTLNLSDALSSIESDETQEAEQSDEKTAVETLMSDIVAKVERKVDRMDSVESAPGSSYASAFDNCIDEGGEVTLDLMDPAEEVGSIPPPPTLPALPNSRRKSILKGPSVPSLASKKVSFKDDTRKVHELHQIKCCIPNCGRTIGWRKKYGKLRLIDHALAHSTHKDLKCKLCKYQCHTIRQMRYHYGKKHLGEKMEGYGMLDMPIDEMCLDEMWNMCYSEHLDVLGSVGNTRRLRRGVKKST